MTLAELKKKAGLVHATWSNGPHPQVILYTILYFFVSHKGLPPEDPVDPTPPTMYHQQPKWVKSTFGKSLIISYYQPKSGRRQEHSRIELQKNRLQGHIYIIK